MNEKNPIAVITGPTSGIGKAFSQELANQGYNLVLVARNKSKLQELIRELTGEFNIKINGIDADLSVAEDIAKVEKVISSLSRIDLLINNAGFGVGGYFIEVPLSKQLDMLTVHLNSTIQFCRAAIPVMANQKVKGNIINVASFAVFIDVPGNVMYSTTKSAVVHFSKTLQCEVKDYNIKIQALCPVFTPTSFHESINRDLSFMKNIPDFFWTPVDDVINSSLNGLHSGNVICIPGRFNKVIYWFNKFPLFSILIQKLTLMLNNRDKAPAINLIEEKKKEKVSLVESEVVD